MQDRQALTVTSLFDSVWLGSGSSDRDRTARGKRTERRRWTAPVASGSDGTPAGLQPKSDSGHAFEWDLIRKQERDTLNRSRGLAQGHDMAEDRCGGEAGRPTPVSNRAWCRGKLRGNWAREGSLPWLEGPEMHRGGRAVVQGWIRGSTAECGGRSCSASLVI